MNFLLHHHLAARRLGRPAAAHGAMLPDLWRMADRRVRPHPDSLAAPAPGDAPPGPHDSGDRDGARDLEVAAGIAHHLASDAWFHRAEVFTNGERHTAERFRAAELVAPRMGLLAHACWELCLDGALARACGPEAIVAALARGAHEGDGASDRAATSHHFARHDRSVAERATFDGHMRTIVSRLVDGTWVRAYAEPAGLVRITDGLRRRVGLSPLGDRDRARLAELFDVLLAEADARLPALLAAAP